MTATDLRSPAPGPAPGPRAETSAAGPDPATGTSCLYEGTVSHRRLVDVDHAFTYPVLLAHLDLAEVDTAFRAHPLWSGRHVAPVRFRRADYHGDPDVPLDDAVRRTVQAATGTRPTGPIRLLAALRTWGWCFNPIALYFCADADDTRVDTVLAEVTNTPWHERRAYVLPVPHDGAAADGIRFPKQLHVSPFLDDEGLDHVLRFTPPGAERLRVEMDDARGDQTVFRARLDLHRLPLDRRTMTSVLWRHRLPAHRISAGIHAQALRLWRKGAPFHPHPDSRRAARRAAKETP